MDKWRDESEGNVLFGSKEKKKDVSEFPFEKIERRQREYELYIDWLRRRATKINEVTAHVSNRVAT